jgi:type I restriction enzyme S subunit
LPLPALREQIESMDTLDSLDDSIRNEREEMQKLTQLKSGLMSDLLTGRVRVPDDLVEGAP